jgi:hypothetical protein
MKLFKSTAHLKKVIAIWEILRVRVAWPMIVPVPPTFEENAMERSIIALNSIDHKINKKPERQANVIINNLVAFPCTIQPKYICLYLPDCS